MKFHFHARRNDCTHDSGIKSAYVDGIYDTMLSQDKDSPQTIEEIYTDILEHAKVTLNSQRVSITSLTKLED